MRYRGVIFAMDGVICFTDRYHCQAWTKLANRLGVSQVLYRTGTLTMRLDSRCTPDPGILLPALSQTDRRLSLSAKGPTALLLRDPALAERDMLREGVKVLKQLCGQVDELREAQASKA